MIPEILYEDNHLIVVNKPPGMLVHGDKTGDPTLEEAVKAWIKEKYQKPGNVFARAVHRLDRPVSGAVLIGKTSKGHTRMAKLFRDREVDKVYWALTARCPSPAAGAVRQFLTKDNEDNVVSWHDEPVPDSKEAFTEYRLLGEVNGLFLIELHPQTGRSHQLRVLMRSKRCPIAGDLKYNGRKISSPHAILLHARELSFEHPVKQERIHIIAPLPDLPEWKGAE
ncbi:MAG TPA: RluA family pseudouridine synthase [Saprospiraceae bacterium]|nr:RluA family pseudouridine synthase [Saprospiraceae bacterium]